jgi:serine/threonine-protein kinase
MLVQRGGDPDFVKVLDFGVARADAAEYPAIATRAGAIFGSARYVAPECAAGGASTPASDVYALATLGYECLSGSTPFDGENAIQILLKQQSAPIPSLRVRAPQVPSALAELLERNLAKSPEARAQDARQFARALLSAAAETRLDPAHTRRGHALSLPSVPVSVPVSLPTPAPASDLPLKSRSPARVIVLCFLLGITAALGIAQQLGAFDVPPPKAGPP